MQQPTEVPPIEDHKMKEPAAEDNTSDVRFPAEELFGDVPPDK